MKVSGLTKGSAVTLVVATALVVGVASGAALRAIRSSPPGEDPARVLADPSPSGVPRSTGTAPALTLPDDALTLRAAFRDGRLYVLARIRLEQNLSLFVIEGRTARVLSKTRLPLEEGGQWTGLAVDEDGTAWAASRSSIVRVARQRITELTPPPAQGRVGGPPSPGGLPPIEDGQITAVAIAQGRVLFGRAGFAEVTVLDPATLAFTRIATPSDVRDLAPVSGGAILTTGRGQGGTPSGTVALVDVGASLVRALPLAANGIASNGSRFVAATPTAMALLDRSGVGLSTGPASGYDLDRLALTSGDLVIARVGGVQPQVAVIEPSGRESRRFTYSTVLDKKGDAMVPFASRFSFVVIGDRDEAWFGLVGRPDVYRLP